MEQINFFGKMPIHNSKKGREKFETALALLFRYEEAVCIKIVFLSYKCSKLGIQISVALS